MTDERDQGATLDLDEAAGAHDHDADGRVVDDPVASGDGAAVEAARADLDPGDASLLALVDRLGSLLDRSDLSELAVEAGRTRLVLRKPAAIAPVPTAATAGSSATEDGPGGATAAPAATGAGQPSASPTGPAEAPARPSVKAPLTGVWYSSPAPGSAPFVAAGREVAVGQVIGLIEAMKLFNEIKSDLAGRVVRVIPDSGALVKAKQPLIEVEPL
jgi:acetyl-CoA carboxylase biotin carboxyl carrier protein